MAASQGPGPPPAAGRIAVGVDGSPGSRAALRWALGEALARGLALHAVIAWEFPPESSFGDMDPVDDFRPVVAAEETLAAVLGDAGVSATDETVTSAALEGHPAEVLLKVAEDSQLLVVGSRGHGTIVGALLGSVSQYVAAHADCPVVVIKAPASGALRAR